ncbi:MAG: HisA/HisF-related TIM barrel protein [Candidatus Hodarchaeales archaeon]
MSKSNLFEIIPVIDLLDGSVVRGVKGERNCYKPVEPVFCNSSDPLAIAASYRDYFNFSSIYIADLDRITGQGNNLDTVKKVKDFFPDPGQVYCDPGIKDSSELNYLSTYVDNLVIGTETISSLQLISDAGGVFGTDRVTLSLDIKNGQVLSHAKELIRLDPLNTVSKILTAGNIQRLFIIVLDAVGSFSGVNSRSYSSLQRDDLAVYLGGGVSDLDDITRLRKSGYSGCLIASCLYNGSVTPEQVREYR